MKGKKMRAMLLVMAALGQYCNPGVAGAQPFYPAAAPSVVEKRVTIYQMADAKGQPWTHADPAFLAKWIKERDERFKAEAEAEASKKAENFGLNLAGIQAQAKGTLDTNDRDFGAKVMNPVAEEVPIPEPPAPEDADDYKVVFVILGCVAVMVILTRRRDR